MYLPLFLAVSVSLPSVPYQGRREVTGEVVLPGPFASHWRTDTFGFTSCWLPYHWDRLRFRAAGQEDWREYPLAGRVLMRQDDCPFNPDEPGPYPPRDGWGKPQRVRLVIAWGEVKEVWFLK